MSDWIKGFLADEIASLDAGVSVNAEDKPHGAGEFGVLKTSAVSGGRFYANQNKTVVEQEIHLLAEPVQGDSILVSRMNTPALVGESCYVKEAQPTLFLPDRLWQLKPKDRTRLSMRWLSFVLQSEFYRRHVEVHATGTSGSMKNLPKSKLLALTVTYPDPAEQSDIAEVLDTLDNAVAQTEAIIAKLKAVKQGLLHDLLTRGIDANGELRPSQSEAPQLYKPSALGWIPREWNVSSIESTTTNSVIGPFGSDLVASDYRESGVPVVFVRDVKPNRINWISNVYVSPQKATRLAAHEVCPGDVVATKMGFPPCIAAVYPDSLPNGIVTADIVRLKVARDKVRSRWLAYSMNSWAVAKQVEKITAGVTRPKVTLRDVRDLEICVPSLTEQDVILARLEALEARSHQEECELEKLTKAKTGLLDDLLTGNVRVTALLG
jgi:type I restriction enzyme S subunit